MVINITNQMYYILSNKNIRRLLELLNESICFFPWPVAYFVSLIIFGLQ